MTDTNLVPINVPKIINAVVEKTEETSPDVKPLPLLIVEQNIAAIKKGAGILVFLIRNPQNHINAVWNSEIGFLGFDGFPMRSLKKIG